MNSVTGTQYFTNLSDLQAGLDHQALGSDVVRDTGIEPVTSSVSGKRSPAELIARGGDGNRTRVHGFAGRCLTTRPLHRKRLSHTSRADDGIRTRDPNLGKVVRYQLRHVRIAPCCLGSCSLSSVRWKH